MAKSKIKKQKTLVHFCLEMLAVFITVVTVVAVLDSRRVFAYDESNNHTGKRWDYLGRLTRTTPVDILILGNSHAYTGLLPKELSCALGKTCFVLASQGNYLTDAYYMLKEALELTTPELLVIETYLIRDYDQKNLDGGDLTCQIQSFEARRNFPQKLSSSFSLFSFDMLPYAWSPTLRNHSYIFDNRKQLAWNLNHPHRPAYKERLYLGRYVRFQKGLTQKTLERYAVEGAPVKGSEMTVGEDAFKAMEKISRLCSSKGVRVMFLTLPMYKDHLENYGQWRRNVAGLTELYDYPWLDMQQDYDSYGPECFEDTYRHNQHATYTGALHFTYRLADYIRDRWPEMADGTPSEKWTRMFYGEDGYFDYYSPVPGDPRAAVIGRNVDFDGMNIREIIYSAGEKNSRLIVKAQKDGRGDIPDAITAKASFRTPEGRMETAVIELARSEWIDHPDHHLYSVRLRKGLVLAGLELVPAATDLANCRE